MGRVYLGLRVAGEVAVYVSRDGGASIPLSPRFDLRNHSPCGFNWGYNGAGPTQLALAMLADAYGNDAVAELWYFDFRREVLAPLQVDEFQIDQEAVIKWLVDKLKRQLLARQI